MPAQKKKSSSKQKSGIADGYLHGFSEKEQDRLYRQATFLAPWVFENVDFGKCRNLIEVGCGVGAQTEILLNKFPHLHIQGVDASEAQIKRASQHLKKFIKADRVTLSLGDAMKLPFEDNRFDSAFVCWLLEHVRDPIGILKELHRVLASGGLLYCSEVFNSSFFVHPYSPNMLRYWFEFNDHQWSLKGDPFVGAKLGNYLLSAGYRNIRTQVITYHFDNRTPKMRAQFIEEWTSLLLSGAPELLKARKVTEKVVNGMRQELQQLKEDHNSVFFYSWIQAQAQAL